MVLPEPYFSLSDSRDTSCAIRFFSEPVPQLRDSWDNTWCYRKPRWYRFPPCKASNLIHISTSYYFERAVKTAPVIVMAKARPRTSRFLRPCISRNMRTPQSEAMMPGPWTREKNKKNSETKDDVVLLSVKCFSPLRGYHIQMWQGRPVKLLELIWSFETQSLLAHSSYSFHSLRKTFFERLNPLPLADVKNAITENKCICHLQHSKLLCLAKRQQKCNFHERTSP